MAETKKFAEGFNQESFAKGVACGLYLIYSTMQQFKFAYTSAEEWIDVVSGMPSTLGNDVQYYFAELNRDKV